MASEENQPQSGESRQSAPPLKLRLSMDRAIMKQSTPPRPPEDRQHTDARPSFSPITPTLSHPTLAFSQTQHALPSQTQWMEEPEAPPVDLEENTDAMAMRAAISILQMQRQQTVKDMKELNKLKQTALESPEAFMAELKAGKLTPTPRDGINVDEEDSDGQDDAQQGANGFSQMPAAQNVVRAPPIEWSKYHIVGEPLDRMHEAQRTHPGFKEEMLDAEQKPQPHKIATPYMAFGDKLDDASAPP